MQSLNLGIVAHVDAGKTSLTERLLYEAGAIDHLGSVDRGDTQTDTLSVERERGITVRSAVVSFEIRDEPVNLIDTPGHPDFIAEVERVLRVLDGAVLVVSAVEGVQAQTRLLMRALGRLEIPTLVFVNKIDRPGARAESLLGDIHKALGLTVVPMGSASDLGTAAASATAWEAGDAGGREAAAERLAETLGRHDESVLSAFLEDDGGPRRLELLAASLRSQTQCGVVHPVYFGSARTGAGIDGLMSGIVDLLPAPRPADPDAPALGTVFKIERGEAREKIAYVRLFSGTVRTRDQLRYGEDHEDKVVALAAADGSSASGPRSVSAGSIVKIWGLKDVQIGDRIGAFGRDVSEQQFAPPTMESFVHARRSADGARLRAALGELAEQDPLIRARQDQGGIAVSLYGEVQKQVIQSVLLSDYGIEADFGETATIYVERPDRRGEAVASLTSDANPFMATVGLRVEPGHADSGLRFELAIDQRSVPVYIYKSEAAFVDHMAAYARQALRRGLFGWEVTDCVVTLTECDYYIGDGPAKPTVPMARTTSTDFRLLTPTVLRRAIEAAGTHVCEPMVRLTIEVPSPTVGDLLQMLSHVGASVLDTQVDEELSAVVARMPADRLRQFQARLPDLTGGEGASESRFDGYEPVPGRPPRRTTIRGGTAEA